MPSILYSSYGIDCAHTHICFSYVITDKSGFFIFITFFTLLAFVLFFEPKFCFTALLALSLLELFF